jgi:DNA-binding MarR family transcriptional regulator
VTLDARVAASVRRNPGSGAAEIAERLGEPVVDVSAALRRLRAAGRITKRGNTRAARYA